MGIDKMADKGKGKGGGKDKGKGKGKGKGKDGKGKGKDKGKGKGKDKGKGKKGKGKDKGKRAAKEKEVAELTLMTIEHLLMFQAMLHKTSYMLAFLSFTPEGIKFIFRGIVVGSSRGLSCVVQAARIGLLR